MLHADVVWKSAAGDKTIFSADSNVPKGSDAGAAGSIVGDFSGDAVPAKCGDTLVLELKFVSGTSDYIEFSASLAIP